MEKSKRFKRRNILKLSGATVAALAGPAGVVAGNEEEMVEYIGYYTGSPTNRTKVWQKVGPVSKPSGPVSKPFKVE